MTVDELNSLHIAQLRSKANGMGLVTKLSEKKEDLIKRIVNFEQEIRPKEPEPEQKIEIKAPKKSDKVSFSELEAALSPLIEKGLHVENRPDNTFYFCFKGKEDSGTLYQPLRTIIGRAQAIAR